LLILQPQLPRILSEWHHRFHRANVFTGEVADHISDHCHLHIGLVLWGIGIEHPTPLSDRRDGLILVFPHQPHQSLRVIYHIYSPTGVVNVVGNLATAAKATLGASVEVQWPVVSKAA
jgi:hypothetical protein